MRIAMAALLASLFFLGTAWALTIKDRYYQAEEAYAALKKNPSHQKYRDKWLACIEKYNLVQRLDPGGPWAAAGFYKAGLLYLDLYQRSHLSADQQAAVDLFQRIIQQYPESRYTPKSRDQLSGLGKPIVSPNTAAAAKQLEKAHAAHDRLSASPNRQKYRDQWLRCIDLFQAAYQTDPKGPYAAECLYTTAVLYRGLSDASHRSEDSNAAIDYFRRVKHEFADSTYAAKAADALKTEAGTDSAKAASPTRPSPDDKSTDPVGKVIAQSGKTSAAKATPDKTDIGSSGSKLVTVQDLRVWSNPKYTRVVVDADQETPFTHRLLKKDPSINKPQRLYLELDRSRLGKNIDKFVPINDNLLIDARAGQYTNDSVRIVVDIKSFKNYKIFSLKNPFRIVLDVWGVDTTSKVAAKQLASIPPPRSPGKLPPGAIARQLALGVSRIIIDPGHGGKDYGAPGYAKNVHEKDVVLQIAKRLAKKVERELKCDAILTRSTDRYLTLEERTAIANTQNADLFISIHTNAVRDSRAYGIETYFLNLATDDDAIRVAARENATSAKNISDLESILNDLMQNAKINESSRLAAMVQESMCHHLNKEYSDIRSKGVKQAPFYVLLGAQMPAILVETAFISNPRECKRLTSTKYQEDVCDGIIRGIRTYIKDTLPTAFADPPRSTKKRKG